VVDGPYRYELRRIWDERRGLICYIGLNPSVADMVRDDHTARKWAGFTKGHGYGGFVAMNLFAWVTPHVPSLKRAHADGHDIVGPDNDRRLVSVGQLDVGAVVACWGDGGAYLGRDRAVVELFRKAGVPLWCWGRTRAGQPKHPARLPYQKELFPYASP
jgi:hypothetical protein